MQVTENDSTADDGARKTWCERNDSLTKGEKGALGVEYQEAEARIGIWLNLHAADLADELRERVALKALERWTRESREGVGAAVFYAKKELATATKKPKPKPDRPGPAKHLREQAIGEVHELADRTSEQNEDPLKHLEATRRAAEEASYATVDEAKRPTLSACARIFSELVQMEWEDLPRWAVHLLEELDDNQANDTEEMARAAIEKLQEAVLAVRALVERSAITGVRAKFVRRLDGEMRGPDWDAVAEYGRRDSRLDITEASLGNLRQRVAYRWPTVRWILLNVAERPEAIEAKLAEAGWTLIRDVDVPVSDRELAIVAILLGEWPEGMKVGVDGVTPEQIIKSVARGFGAGSGAKPAAQRVVDAAAAYQASLGERKV